MILRYFIDIDNPDSWKQLNSEKTSLGSITDRFTGDRDYDAFEEEERLKKALGGFDPVMRGCNFNRPEMARLANQLENTASKEENKGYIQSSQLMYGFRKPESYLNIRTNSEFMREKISEEDYLRAIYHLEREENRPIKSVELAEFLKVSKPTISEMVRKFSNEGLVNFQSYRRISLTKKGLKKAERITFRHRIIETFLIEILGLSKKKVHEEAHKLEHAFSDKAIEKINRLLKNPKFCPHGKPIPRMR